MNSKRKQPMPKLITANEARAMIGYPPNINTKANGIHLNSGTSTLQPKASTLQPKTAKPSLRRALTSLGKDIIDIGGCLLYLLKQTLPRNLS